MTIDDFELLKVIGKGGYSQVVMARKKDSGFLYAIKIMDKKHLLTCMTPSAIVRECEINRKLKNKFVIELYWAFQNSKFLSPNRQRPNYSWSWTFVWEASYSTF